MVRNFFKMATKKTDGLNRCTYYANGLGKHSTVRFFQFKNKVIGQLACLINF
jgi:hypothetical protein